MGDLTLVEHVYVDIMERREPVQIQDARKISWELYVKKNENHESFRQKDDINCNGGRI